VWCRYYNRGCCRFCRFRMDKPLCRSYCGRQNNNLQPWWYSFQGWALDFERPNDRRLRGYYFLTCRRDGTSPAYKATDGFNILMNDTNSRSPIFEIENPNFRHLAVQWRLQLLTRSKVIKVNDMDFEKENAALVVVTLKMAWSTLTETMTMAETRDGIIPTYNLFLNAEATPGNYTFELQATDGHFL